MKSDNQKFKNEFKKRLYKLVLEVINIVNTLNKTASNEVIGKQLLRSITSILANYIEAIAASSKKDFTNFFHHSLKSANESKVWIVLLKNTNNSLGDRLPKVLDELTEISNIIAKSIITLKNK
jgi:four helix bundle protein